MALISDDCSSKTGHGDPATEYAATQASAEHHDKLAWTAAGTLWAGSLILLGFVIESIKQGRSRVLLTAVCLLGIGLTAAVWWISSVLQNVKRQKYARCRQLESVLGYEQHSRLAYPQGKQSLVFGLLMAAFLIVWILAIGSIWCTGLHHARWSRTMTFEESSLWIQGAGVFATLCAVIVAIWGEWIRQRLSRPKLMLELAEASLTTTKDGKRGWYYGICVKNHRPSCPARNVRVLLTGVLKQSPDGSWHQQRFSGPIQMVWGWPEFTPQYLTIGPEERATFGFVLEGTDAFQLRLSLYPNNLPSTIPAGEPTRLEFKAVADTVQTSPMVVQVEWNGKWTGNPAEMRENLVLRHVQA